MESELIVCVGKPVTIEHVKKRKMGFFTRSTLSRSFDRTFLLMYTYKRRIKITVHIFVSSAAVHRDHVR